MIRIFKNAVLPRVPINLTSRRFLSTRFFSDTHEWIDIEGTLGTIGITKHAQEHLGDIVYVSLPSVGEVVKAKGVLGEVESVKATSMIFSPVTGKIQETNDELKNRPKLISDSPDHAGWLVKVELSEEPIGLMNSEEYEKFLVQ